MRYYFIGNKEQVYNSEEQAVLFIVHVMKANQDRRESAAVSRKKQYSPQHNSNKRNTIATIICDKNEINDDEIVLQNNMCCLFVYM